MVRRGLKWAPQPKIFCKYMKTPVGKKIPARGFFDAFGDREIVCDTPHLKEGCGCSPTASTVCLRGRVWVLPVGRLTASTVCLRGRVRVLPIGRLTVTPCATRKGAGIH